MDYIIEGLFADGFKPETKRETAFVEELRDDGFVFFDKLSGKFKIKSDVIKTETPDDITLKVVPKINYLGLFPKVDNFKSDLLPTRVRHIMLEFLGNCQDAEGWLKENLSGLRLGQEFALTALGYGKTETNEGYKFELPEDLLGLSYRGNKICYLTTGMVKNGKERDTKNIEFLGLRPTKMLFRLGISTTLGVFYCLDEFKDSGSQKVIDKAMLK